MKKKVSLQNIALGVLVPAAIILIGFLLKEIAYLYIDLPSIDEKIFSRRKDIIALIAQIIGGFGFFIVVFLAWKRIEVAQEGQITERFTRAIDQLGATNEKGEPKIEIRLGGIYALERIARDSKADHSTVMEVLTAYVRENSPWPPKSGGKPDQPESEKVKEVELKKNEKLHDPSSDIKAIVQVLKQRKIKHEKGEIRRLNLTNTYLRMADFGGAYLNGTKLIFSHLILAELGNAKLIDAKLQGAELAGADLKGADLTGADLERANLDLADLEGANLKGANLKEANLTLTNLRGVKCLNVEQLCKAKTLFETKLDEELMNRIKEFLNQEKEKYEHLFKKPESEDDENKSK